MRFNNGAFDWSASNRSSLAELRLNPKRKLNKGHAKQPIIAIPPYPFFEILYAAAKSPIQFPTDKNVTAKKVGEILKIIP